MIIVLGSGGHTAEMLQLVRNLDTARYSFRRYVVSSGDGFSARKAAEFEASLATTAASERKQYGHFEICEVARARRVHQSLLSTPFTALLCVRDCIQLLLFKPSKLYPTHSRFPDVILTNGPATATIMIFASVIIRFLGFGDCAETMRCVYVESWARVKKLSLSGRILRASGACDRFLVQWPSLVQRGTEFRGQLIA